jgi:hypothetical protein
VLRQIIAWWVGQNDNPNTSGTTTAVTLLGKYPAMMTTAQDSSRSELMWIEAGTEFTILGPSLNQNACIRLAAQLASQALARGGVVLSQASRRRA